MRRNTAVPDKPTGLASISPKFLTPIGRMIGAHSKRDEKGNLPPHTLLVQLELFRLKSGVGFTKWVVKYS